MADLADMIQRLAYYQAGGKDPGTGTLDKLNTGVGIVDKTITDVLAIKKAKLEGQKNKLETAKLGSEKTKLDLGNAPASNYLKPATPAGTAGTDGQPVVTPQAPEYDLNRMTPDQQDTFASADLKRAQTDYLKSGKKEAAGTKEDLLPLSKIMTLAEAQKAYPTTTPEQYQTMTIGGFKQLVGAGKQSDLNFNRGQVRDESRDRMVMNLRESINRDPILTKIREQDLGLDVTKHISDLVASGNTVAGAALGLKEAKGLGEVGVMTERDVTRYVTSGMLSQRGADILGRWLRGTPSDATQQEIAEINNVMHQRLTEKINESYGQYVDLLANNFDMTREEAAHRLAIILPKSISLGSGQSGGGDVNMQQIQTQLPAGAKIKSIKRIN